MNIMTKQDFEQMRNRAFASEAYKNYQEVREVVFAMLQHQEKVSAGSASAYWSTELEGMDYMLDASPLIIQKLRHHCYHLTGLREYEYRDHHARAALKLEQRLAALQAHDQSGLLVPESPLCGGFGFKIGNGLYNVDTLRFYESLIVLDWEGILNTFRNAMQRNVALEIGGGWGGFAYQFKTLFPNTTYIAVDLPGSILFGATYLKTLFPQARVYLSDGSEQDASFLAKEKYDFAFFPHFAWPNLTIPKPDILINLASFQEMTTEQVNGYISRAATLACPVIYSCNRDRSPNNPELSRISEILSQYYTMTADFPGFDTQSKAKFSFARDMVTRAKRIAGSQKAKRSEDIYAYRHLLGKRSYVDHHA